MSNPSRPADTRCPADALVIECSFVGSPLPGVCRYCDLGTCSLCGGVMSPDECATSRAECPVPHRNEVYCPTCLGAIKGDAVPVAVETEGSGAQTVRLDSDPSIRETGAEWCGKLSAGVAS